MFDSYIGDIDHDISVLAMDKILYDNGFSVTDSEIHSDSEYETFFDALLTMDGYIDEDESDEADCTVMVFRNGCLKRYIGLALKYGSMNGLPKGNNFWISRLEAHINNKMRSIGDYSYDWDYNVSSTKKAFLKVYIGPEFYQTVEMIQAIASILHFANTSCKELERLKNMAENTDLDTVMHRLSLLQDCRERMAKVMNKRVEFEMALIRLCGNSGNTAQPLDKSEIYDKIKQLENKILSGAIAAPAAGRQTGQPVLTAKSPAMDAEPAPSVDIKKLRPEDLVPCKRWNEILEEFKKVNPSVAGSLDDSEAASAGNVMFITAKNRFFVTLFKNKENAVSLGETIYRVLGQRYTLRVKCATSENQQKSLAEQMVKKAIDSSIETAVENN